MDIRSWLVSLDLEQYADIFEENDIGLEDLTELSADELKDDLGVTSLGHRKKILKAIENLGGIGEEEQSMISGYPYLIAYPLKMMLEEKNNFQKLQLMKDVFLNLLKYIGLLAATEYFFSAIKSAELNTLFKEKLYQPHFGHWNHFIRESLAILKDNNHAFIIPELPAYYDAVQIHKKAPKYNLETRYTDDLGEMQTLKKNLTAIDGLINFRNRYIGHGVTLSQEQSGEIFDTYYPLLKDLLLRLDFCIDYPLFRYRDGKIFRLMGMTAQPDEDQKAPDDPAQSIWLTTPGGMRLPLLPFFIPPEQYMAEFSSNIQLFIYEQHTSRRILYFSPEQTSGEAAGEPVNMLNRLMDEKSRLPDIPAADLDAGALAEMCDECSNRIIMELQQERKVLPEIYQHREENEQEVESFLNSRAEFYFIAAEAGSGKTNLLAEIYRQCRKDGKPALLLRAGRLEKSSFPDVLRDILRLPESDEIRSIRAFQDPAPGNLVVLLDGMNEHRSPQQLFTSLNELFSSVPTGVLKVIVSWRVNSLKDYPEGFDGMEDRIFSTTAEFAAAGGTVLQRSAGRLKPLNKKELTGAWSEYGEFKQKIYKPQFTLEDLEQKDRLFVQNLSNPLLLRMFLEIYNGKGLSSKQKVVRIWPAWHASLRERIPGADEFLMTLIEQMYRKEATELDLDGLYDHPLLSEIMRQLDINSPFRRLIALGVLSQYFKNGYLVVSFTLEAAYHYLLSRYLTERMGISTGTDLNRILEDKKHLSGVKEAVGICLLDDVVTGGKKLTEYIAVKGMEPDAAALPLAKALELRKPEELITSLADVQFNNTAETLLLADYALERNLLTEIRYRAFSTLIMRPDVRKAPADLRFRILWRYNIVTHERGKYEEALVYARKMEEARIESGNPDELTRARVCNRLSVAYRKLMRSVDEPTAEAYGEKALEYSKAALSIMERDLPANHPELCKVYDNTEKVHEYRGEWKDAISFGRKLIEALEASLDRWHPSLAPAYNNTAIVLRENGQEAESIAYSERAMEIVSRSLDPNHIEMAYANWTLANTYDKFGKPEEAVKSITRTITILKKLLPDDHPNMTMAHKALEGFKNKIA